VKPKIRNGNKDRDKGKDRNDVIPNAAGAHATAREIHTAEPQTTTASSRTPALSGRPSALAEGERSEAGAGISRVSPQDAGAASRPAFHYWDKGSLATIGRAAAVAEFGKFHISGFLAWLSWLFVHIFFLIGFQNRILVLIQWAWSYMTYERGARLITGSTYLPGWTTEPRATKSAAVSNPQEIRSSAK
jgi:NADH dehydrogenase FAD-containing subunit